MIHITDDVIVKLKREGEGLRLVAVQVAGGPQAVSAVAGDNASNGAGTANEAGADKVDKPSSVTTATGIDQAHNCILDATGHAADANDSPAADCTRTAGAGIKRAHVDEASYIESWTRRKRLVKLGAELVAGAKALANAAGVRQQGGWDQQ